MVIVGHCPTNIMNPGDTLSKIHQKPEYANCDKGDQSDTKPGCVLIHCKTADHLHEPPRLAFVDVGLSKGQRFPTWGGVPEIPNKDRDAQILRLTHDENLRSDKRYYNVIERVTNINTIEALYKDNEKPKLRNMPKLQRMPTAKRLRPSNNTVNAFRNLTRFNNDPLPIGGAKTLNKRKRRHGRGYTRKSK